MDYLRRLHQSRYNDSGEAIALSVQPKLVTDSGDHAHIGEPPSTTSASGRAHARQTTLSMIDKFDQSRSYFTGWRVGATAAAVVACATLVINAVALQWLKNHPNVDTSLVEVYRGDCHRVEQMHIWSHFAINALSTLLLSGSNYCMQVLCAPTRSALDRAHASRRYLDIGVQSLRNLRHISPYRALVWWILGLSSIPLHLMYNSAFYSSIGTSNYRMDFVSEGYAEGEPLNATITSLRATPADQCGTNTTCIFNVIDQLNTEAYTARMERLDARACLDAYATTLLTERSNMVLVTSNASNIDNTLLQGSYYSFSTAIVPRQARYKPFDWICYSSDRMRSDFDEAAVAEYERLPCDAWVDQIVASPGEWTPYDFSVDHCLSERIEERCSFNGNVSILTVVIVFNIVKILCMLWVAFGLGIDVPLITVGDAIASYLRHPDPVTKGYCLWGRDDFTRSLKWTHHLKLPPDAGFIPKHAPKHPMKASDPRKARAATRRRYRWGQGATRQRWFWTLFLVALALVVVLALFGAGYGQIKAHRTPVSALGFGKIHASALVNGWGIAFMEDTDRQIATAIVVANLPQTVLSFLYLNLNSLVTSLALTAETLSYARAPHRPLRVSLPQTATPQRGTYFLQLPYHLAFPLMALSGLLHWLVSQSFFLAVVAEYDWDGALVNATAVATCGYSLVPMMAVMGLGVGILVGLAVAGWCGRWDAGGGGGGGGGGAAMPLAGSCSLAISAMCHPPAGDEGADKRPVRWGVVAVDAADAPVDGEMGESVGHCSFSSGGVGDVVVGSRYA